MTFEEMLDQALAMLQRRGRLTYRTLQRQFHLDDDALNDLKDAILYAHPEVHDDAGRGLVWTGESSRASQRALAGLVRYYGDAGVLVRALLAPIYGWFTEGFDTVDLQEAKSLLEALAG